MPLKLADQAFAQQVEVANGVEDLVFNELIFVAQAVFVEHLVVAHCDGVVHARTKGEIAVSQLFELMHKAECACTTHLFHERGAAKVDGGLLCILLVHRVVVEQRIAHLEPIERH